MFKKNKKINTINQRRKDTLAQFAVWKNLQSYTVPQSNTS